MGDHQEMADLKKIREMYQLGYPSEIQTLEWSLHGFMADMERVKADYEIKDKETAILDYWDKWACNYVRLKKDILTPASMYLPTEDLTLLPTEEIPAPPVSKNNVLSEEAFGIFMTSQELDGKTSGE
jgi:seryl-tRNA synthetase